ncbi:MAG: GAF domain-containing protein [Ignavibacteria bacterium]|nr:GAF domain-containing protein [Ignavibacteria bacterium]OIO24123.1 MAG: diguanylate cyclase [Ignavibacteria bacterium CG1_02_37_35]PIS44759.1 MAG: diguanylate cyclase [Ignavibacteria bacterium CG08_land_8_20_14_0_20_37_9]
MDRRQKKRLLFFLIFPVLLSITFFVQDVAIRIIALLLSFIYVGSILFLRDNFRKIPLFDLHSERGESDFSQDQQKQYTPPSLDEDSSFEIIAKHSSSQIITEDNYFKVKAPQSPEKPHDLKERFAEIVNEELPKEVGYDGQFSFILEKILSVIKEAYASNTAIFFWYNKKKEKLSVERYISNSTDVIKSKLGIEDDILSKIVTTGDPELLSDISKTAEADVIRYYNKPQGIKSFVGVPIFYEKELIGVLAIDSKTNDSFGIETIFSLGRFVRLITILINIFEQKFSEFVSQRRLHGLLSLITPSSSFEHEKDVMQALEKSIEFLLAWDAFVFVYYNPPAKNFKTMRVRNKTSLKYVGENLEVELNGTLAGKSILTGLPVKIDDTSANDYKRFSKNEDVTFDGSFVVIPLVFQNQNYGALCFESLRKNAYSKSDIDFLLSSVGILSFIIYSFATQNALKSYLAIDIETKALNTKTFNERVSQELIKAKEFNLDCSVALIRIDEFLEQESLFDGNPFTKILASISEMILSEIDAYKLFGRLDEKVFAVFFLNYSAKDVYIWAEKLRVKVARQPISVVARQTTFTISVGVASAKGKTDHEEVLYNANLALEKAIEGGGNKVRNIN